MDQLTHNVRTQNWAQIIQACNTSGMPKKQWCEENGISRRKFYYWQKKIREVVYTKATGTGAELVVPTSSHEDETLAPSFAELPTTPIPVMQRETFQPDAVITVGNISIQIANTATRELLERVGQTMLGHAV